MTKRSFYTAIPALAGFVLLALPNAAWAQQAAAGVVTTINVEEIPVFHVDVVSRTVKSVSFHYRQGSTELAMTGTNLAPQAKGTVRADSRTGATKLDINADKLPKPWTINDSMLTYVVWAITPEGRPEAVGELALSGDDAHLSASSELQSFGLIVTAEPYFAVTQPSNVVVMEGTVTNDTAGTIRFVEAKYELLPPDAYTNYLPAVVQTKMKGSRDVPGDLLQARHAMAIADSFGANYYATDTMSRARTDLKNAEDYYANKGDKKKIESLSRYVTQMAEDARLIAVRKRQADALEAERTKAQKRVDEAQTAADREARSRELAETDRRLAIERAEQARMLAEQEVHQRRLAEERQAVAVSAASRAEADKTRAEAEKTQAERARAEAEADLRRVQAETTVATIARQQAEQARQQAEAEKSRTAQLLADARVQQSTLSAQAEEAQRRAQEAESARQKAEADRLRTREELMRQLNVILVTKETARGLVVNMSDVLFDTGKAQLKPGAQVKLAKVSGILATHPDLKLEIEGHTDSIGSAATNMALSEKRATAVREFLVTEGVSGGAVTAIGRGEDVPVASNATAAGRQQNRRVEIIVSGESIKLASH